MSTQAEHDARSRSGIFNRSELTELYRNVRNFSEFLCRPLITEDYVIQAMSDVSPAKWHLAHVTWFFETFILHKLDYFYKKYNEKFTYIFNSYYVSVGNRHTRSERGFLSRPSVEDIYNYREYVDEHLVNLIMNCSDKVFEQLIPLVELGINHEQQHQELILSDIKYNFSVNPLYPVYAGGSNDGFNKTEKSGWINYEGGLTITGYRGQGFAYDNEQPEHTVYLQPFSLASKLVTNREYIEFIEDGGYKRAELWLSDGFDAVETNKWPAPLYWKKEGKEWYYFTLSGYRKISESEPVCHLSFYEADAFARWKGARLPTEFEWELAAGSVPIKGNFVESGRYNPAPAPAGTDTITQLYGDVWEWTASAYLPYPGFKPAEGAIGEYNGKFMSGQMILRGGSCATSIFHIRKTYRNFFPPNARWQFMGFRLAKYL